MQLVRRTSVAFLITRLQSAVCSDLVIFRPKADSAGASSQLIQCRGNSFEAFIDRRNSGLKRTQLRVDVCIEHRHGRTATSALDHVQFLLSTDRGEQSKFKAMPAAFQTSRYRHRALL